MKNLTAYLTEASNNSQKLQPRNRRELIDLIQDELRKQDNNDADLNHIDVSKIDDMSYLFTDESGLSRFNGDISKWDVSNVTNMHRMFDHSIFTGENGGISDWDVSKVKTMKAMFTFSRFNGDISKWDVSNVLDFRDMFFANKVFNQDISNWKINPEAKSREMFLSCKIKDNFKPKGINKY